MRATTRILLISRREGTEDAAILAAAGLNAMPRLRAILENADHTVSVTSPSQWQNAVGATMPDVVLVEASRDAADEARQICETLKRESRCRIVAVVLTPGDETALWPALRNADADDFLLTDSDRLTLETRVLLLTRLARLEQELEGGRERLARNMQIDEATQLLNRRFFFQNAHRECSRARRYGNLLACLMVDIDYLDEVGKTFGYPCVEYVLRAVAYTVRQWTRDSDILGRFNERKFVALLPETDIQGATSVREKILEALGETRFEWEGKELPISVSIGEAARKYERMYPPVNSASGGSANTQTQIQAAEDAAEEQLSVREELASLLEDADGALSVARRAAIRPEIFVHYTSGTD